LPTQKVGCSALNIDDGAALLLAHFRPSLKHRKSLSAYSCDWLCRERTSRLLT